MNISDLVENLCKEQNISLAELARRTGQFRQNLRENSGTDMEVHYGSYCLSQWA